MHNEEVCVQKDVQLTAADVARLAGVGRAAVSNWRRRHEDFPQPAGGTATSPSFSYAEVKHWLRTHAEGKTFPADEWLWQELRLVTEDEDLADRITAIGVFLLFLQRRPAAWKSLARADDDALARDLPAQVRLHCADLAFPCTVPAGRIALLRQVADQARQRGPLDTFEFLRKRYVELHTRRVYSTPAEIVHLALDLVGDKAESVFDPACGSGSFLIGAHERFGRVRLMGQDIDHAVSRLTAVRLALRSADADIRTGDTLRVDAFPDLAADAVVCNPPFNERNWGYEELTADPRWEYGLPPRMESELAWVQHALARLAAGGTAVLLMTPTVGNRRSGRRIRAQLLRRGALRAVIALPAGSVPNMAVALTLWVLRKPVDSRTPGHLLMVDTASHPEDFARVALRAWRAFREGESLDEAGVCRTVPLVDLLDDEVDLTPGRYLSTAGEALSPERVTGARDRLAGLLHAARGLMPAIEGEGRDLPAVPVSELVRRGMLTLHQQAAAKPGDTSEVPPGSRVLTAKDVVTDQDASGTTPETAVQHSIVVQEGDVVVPQIVQTLVARVVSGGGAVLGTHVTLLRPDPARLDPHFLAGFLCASANLREYSSLSSQFRVDVRRARVPLLPLDEQRRYGTAFRRLAAFQAALRQAAEVGDGLARLVADGLTRGAVQPPADIRADIPADIPADILGDVSPDVPR
ncbi:N-6 DNA Methylase [Sinosporangium album]|uniref:N-6 DNA Methylase n=1 Tax=Sinosporangium album TaxID=504805 RepID=A0A1G8B5G9_9ACTN|nr:N-6 DNA methylase [Sinosporangium album]SDH28426.1 N-6 DNA Methylase [Sinosporangium album]